jgi:hypothetical protein
MSRKPVLVLGVFAVLSGGAPVIARAQDSTGSGRSFLLEARLGTMESVGATSRYLASFEPAFGATLAFQLKGTWWGWLSGDYMPTNWSTMYAARRSPAVGLYTLAGGVSRRVGFPLGLAGWQPFEFGLGVGATQVQVQSTAQSQTAGLPPDAEFDRVSDSGLFSSSRWRPAAAARFRVAVRVVRAVHLTGTAGLIATHVGTVPVWNGGWEPTGDGARYRPSSEPSAFGTILTMPLTLGIGVRF